MSASEKGARKEQLRSDGSTDPKIIRMVYNRHPVIRHQQNEIILHLKHRSFSLFRIDLLEHLYGAYVRWSSDRRSVRPSLAFYNFIGCILPNTLCGVWHNTAQHVSSYSSDAMTPINPLWSLTPNSLHLLRYVHVGFLNHYPGRSLTEFGHPQQSTVRKECECANSHLHSQTGPLFTTHA